MAIEDVVVDKKEMKVIRGVTFGTIDFKSYKKKFESEEKIFKTEFFVDKNTYKEMKKTYKKMSLTEVENADMQRRFHIDAPFPDLDEQYKAALSVKAERTNKKGEVMKLWEESCMGLDLRPKVYDKATGENITSKFYLQAGCVGDLYYTEFTNSFGTTPYIKYIELDTVIPYVKPE